MKKSLDCSLATFSSGFALSGTSAATDKTENGTDESMTPREKSELTRLIEQGRFVCALCPMKRVLRDTGLGVDDAVETLAELSEGLRLGANADKPLRMVATLHPSYAFRVYAECPTDMTFEDLQKLLKARWLAAPWGKGPVRFSNPLDHWDEWAELSMLRTKEGVIPGLWCEPSEALSTKDTDASTAAPIAA